MANILTAGLAYDPYFYAAAALEQLNKRLGMAAFVHRDFESEKGQEKGSTIKLRRPGKFTAQAMPIATGSAQDISPEYFDITLDQWYGSLMTLTDKELTYTKERIIQEHIDPLAIAVADKIDQSLNNLILNIPWIVDDDATTPINDFSNMTERLFNNLAPRTGEKYYQLDATLQKRYEQQSVFYQANTGVDAETLQRDGYLGRKFGYLMFANQNAPTYTTGSAALTSPVITGAHAKGATSLVIGGTSGSGTVKQGTVITITGVTQKYAVTADTAMGASGATLPIEPQLQVALAGAEVVAFDQDTATSIGCAFHKTAFALVMAPLSTVGDGLGIKMATMADPITGLVLRSRLWAEGGTAKVYVGFDALWGVRVLNPNLAVRLQI